MKPTNRKAKLAGRIKDYEETVQRIRREGGDPKGYHKPGSQK